MAASAAGRWASRNGLALLASLCLWPCLVLAVVLLATHTWMATSSLTSYECLRGGGRGSDSLSYLEVNLRGTYVYVHEGWMEDGRTLVFGSRHVCVYVRIVLYRYVFFVPGLFRKQVSFCLDVFVRWLVLVLDRSMLRMFMPAHVVDEIRGVPRYLARTSGV